MSLRSRTGFRRTGGGLPGPPRRAACGRLAGAARPPAGLDPPGFSQAWGPHIQSISGAGLHSPRGRILSTPHFLQKPETAKVSSAYSLATSRGSALIGALLNPWFPLLTIRRFPLIPKPLPEGSENGVRRALLHGPSNPLCFMCCRIRLTPDPTAPHREIAASPPRTRAAM